MMIALENLMSNATVDSTEYIPISDLKSPPLITFCPRQEQNLTTLKKHGYLDINHFCYGNLLLKFISHEKFCMLMRCD